MLPASPRPSPAPCTRGLLRRRGCGKGQGDDGIAGRDPSIMRSVRRWPKPWVMPVPLEAQRIFPSVGIDLEGQSRPCWVRLPRPGQFGRVLGKRIIRPVQELPL
jgi:hypothetical protein